MELNNRIKELRIKNGLTQRQLAERIGVAKSVISYYENGERYPSIDVLIRIASTFRVTTDYLLDIHHDKTLDASALTEEQYLAMSSLIQAIADGNNQSK